MCTTLQWAVTRAQAKVGPAAGHERAVQMSEDTSRSAPADQGYSGPQVCKLVGITYRQLDYWARTGLLRPSINDARGSGSKRRYSYHDVVELKVIKQLLDAGISLQSARRAVDCLREDLGTDLAATNLVLTESRSVLARSDGEVVDLLAGGQGVFNIVPLGGLVDALAADIVRLGRGGPPAAVVPGLAAEVAGA